MKRASPSSVLFRIKAPDGSWLKMQNVGINTPQYYTSRGLYRDGNQLYCRWQNCFVPVELEPLEPDHKWRRIWGYYATATMDSKRIYVNQGREASPVKDSPYIDIDPIENALCQIAGCWRLDIAGSNPSFSGTVNVDHKKIKTILLELVEAVKDDAAIKRKLEDIHVQKFDAQGMTLRSSAPENAIKSMAMLFKQFLGDAENFVTTEVLSPEHGDFEVTVKRKGKLSPAEKIGILEKKVAAFTIGAHKVVSNWKCYCDPEDRIGCGICLLNDVLYEK